MTETDDAMASLIKPGSTIGILGGGQLGQMTAHAARDMGYRVHVLTPSEHDPAVAAADDVTIAPFDDLVAVEAFAQACDVVTLEFENIPVPVAEAAAQHVPVRPGPHVLHIAQDRIREKTSLADAGLPVTPCAPVTDEEDLQAAVARLGTPAVLKTSASGYDGKGQVRINTPDEAAAAWNSLNTDRALYEAFIDYQCEISVLIARSISGECTTIGLFHNTHVNHILDVTCCPPPDDANITNTIVDAAITIAKNAAIAVDIIGVLCIEFFVTKEGALMINEIAPRPHNSGHLTIEAHATSQYAHLVRCVTGMPPGDCTQRSPAAMVNILGDCWPTTGGTPNWAALDDMPDVTLHLYGKTEPRVGRKMGHITALGSTIDEARRKALAARDAIRAT